MPVPARVTFAPGALPVRNGFRVAVPFDPDGVAGEAAARFLTRLARAAGPPAPTEPGAPLPPLLTIAVTRQGSRWPSLAGDESYVLTVGPAGIRLAAREMLGAFRGLATLLQLAERSGTGEWVIPHVTVEDAPRFPWRGLLIDPSRRFLPVPVVLRILDTMEVVKLNVLHWHLTDDQGFRIESRRFPELHLRGSDGLFYTQDEVRTVLEAARRRGIRVVPEFDLPGHATSWFVGMPGLASEPGPYALERSWGIFDPAVRPDDEEVYAVLDAFLGEMAALFPDEYLHVGGDEVNGSAWSRSASVQEFARRSGLASRPALQGAFARRIVGIVAGRGRRAIGWDEVLGAGPDVPVAVESYHWYGTLMEAARSGRPAVLASGYYLDLMFPAAYHYGVDPTGGEAAALAPDEKALVLGGEAAMWGEFAGAENVEARIWPRAAAIAERLWSPADVRDEEEMYRRLEAAARWLEIAGSTHLSAPSRMIARLSGPAAGPSVARVAALVEPVKEYARLDSAPCGATVPLERLVDVAPAESLEARALRREVAAYLAARRGGGETGPRAVALERAFREWRETHAALRAAAPRTGLAVEALRVSARLDAAAAIALEALHRLEGGADPAATWAGPSRDALRALEAPLEDVLPMAARAVGPLVDAAAGHGPR